MEFYGGKKCISDRFTRKENHSRLKENNINQIALAILLLWRKLSLYEVVIMNIRLEKSKGNGSGWHHWLRETNIKLFLFLYLSATWANRLYLLFKPFAVIFFYIQKYPNNLASALKKKKKQLTAFTTEIPQSILLSALTRNNNSNDYIRIFFVSLESST